MTVFALAQFTIHDQDRYETYAAAFTKFTGATS
jgi:hypothetical protein